MANCFITGSQLLADEYESSHKKKVSKCEISSRRVMKYDYLCKCIFFFFFDGHQKLDAANLPKHFGYPIVIFWISLAVFGIQKVSNFISVPFISKM